LITSSSVTDDSLRRDFRWLWLVSLVAGSVGYGYGYLSRLIDTPVQHTYENTPLFWDLGAFPGLFIWILVLTAAIVMIAGRKRDLLPRRSALFVAILASLGLPCALVGLAQLLSMKRIVIDEYLHFDVPMHLTPAPFIATAGLALVVLSAWRLWWIAHTKMLRDLRELARVDREIARDAGDILPSETATPDVEL
jgi:hypothetical protein